MQPEQIDANLDARKPSVFLSVQARAALLAPWTEMIDHGLFINSKDEALQVVLVKLARHRKQTKLHCDTGSGDCTYCSRFYTAFKTNADRYASKRDAEEEAPPHARSPKRRRVQPTNEERVLFRPELEPWRHIFEQPNSKFDVRDEEFLAAICYLADRVGVSKLHCSRSKKNCNNCLSIYNFYHKKVPKHIGNSSDDPPEKVQDAAPSTEPTAQERRETAMRHLTHAFGSDTGDRFATLRITREQVMSYGEFPQWAQSDDPKHTPCCPLCKTPNYSINPTTNAWQPHGECAHIVSQAHGMPKDEYRVCIRLCRNCNNKHKEGNTLQYAWQEYGREQMLFLLMCWFQCLIYPEDGYDFAHWTAQDYMECYEKALVLFWLYPYGWDEDVRHKSHAYIRSALYERALDMRPREQKLNRQTLDRSTAECNEHSRLCEHHAQKLAYYQEQLRHIETERENAQRTFEALRALHQRCDVPRAVYAQHFANAPNAQLARQLIMQSKDE